MADRYKEALDRLEELLGRKLHYYDDLLTTCGGKLAWTSSRRSEVEAILAELRRLKGKAQR